MITPASKTTATRGATETVHHLANDVLRTAEQAFDSTRAFADASLNKAGHKVRDLRHDIEPAIDHLAAKAQRFVRRGLDTASETGAKAQKSLVHYANTTGKYVAEQPMKSVLIAAAAGAAIAALLVTARSRNGS